MTDGWEQALKQRQQGAKEEREAIARHLSESFHRLQSGGTDRDLSVAYNWLCGELRAIEAGEHRR